SAVCLFQSPSQNQGFQCLYISNKARVPVGQLRSRIRTLEINNAIILETHYPDQNIDALLAQ
ncbi:uncharacterized protein B0P05DRAFT_480654, partial [Gilbertella persicaria]|uniref:uncharacterized protein n=1 Tax=Gilbertella persicaria TaxID=101096 RepID=UPI00221FDD6C